MMGIQVDDPTAAILEERTEGWVTGLRLAGLYLRDQADPVQRVRDLRGTTRHIAEYLVAEVLSALEPEMTAHLVETSVLNRFCAPLCDALHARRTERQETSRRQDGERFHHDDEQGNPY